MAFRDYTTDVVEEGDNLQSYTAETAVKQGQAVKLGTSARTVVPSDTDGESFIGFAAYDADSGDTVAVAQSTTTVRATSGTGTISVGDKITSYGGTGNPGEVATASTSGQYMEGEALEDDAGANDDVVVYVDGQGKY